MRSIALSAVVAAVAILVAVLGCTTTVGTKRFAIAEAMDNPDDRQQILEATLRVLDANPKYVREMFAQAREHPQTFEVLLEMTAQHLEEKQLATDTASRLVKHPDSVYQVMVATLEAAKEEPQAQAAIARAIEDRAALAAEAMTTRPSTVERITAATATAVMGDPKATEAFLDGMRVSSKKIAGMLAGSPETLSPLLSDLMQRASRSPRVARVIMQGTARYLSDPTVLEATTNALVDDPALLKQVITSTMQAASAVPMASHAIASAIGDHPDLVTQVVTSRPQSVYAMMLEMVSSARRNPPVRQAMLHAMRQRRDALTEIILSDPETAAILGGALVKEGLQSTSLADQLIDAFRRRRNPAQGVGGSGADHGNER